METINLGRVAFVYKGDYSALTTYNKMDVVFDGESSFVSQIDNNVGNELVNGLNWKYLSRGNNLELQEAKQDIAALETDLNGKVSESDIFFDSYNLSDEQWVVGFISSIDGSISPNPKYITTKNYIKVEPGVSYYFSAYSASLNARSTAGGYLAIYDENKVLIPQPTLISQSTFTPSAGQHYIRTGLRIDVATYNQPIDTLNYMVCSNDRTLEQTLGDAPNRYPYVKFGYLDMMDYKKIELPNSRGYGSIVSFGDSITQFGFYPELIGKIIGAKSYNSGFGGTRLSFWGSADNTSYDAFSFTNIVDSIVSGDWSIQEAAAPALNFLPTLNIIKSINYSELPIMTIFYGTNDFTGSIPLGVNTDTTRMTFKGSINYVINKLITAFPKMRLIFITPMYRFWNETNNDADNQLNSINLLTSDYVNAIKEIADLNRVEYIDLTKIGWNKYNKTLYSALSDGTHLTAYGYREVGYRISNYILSH